MCLFEIVEIIVKNDSSTDMFMLSKQIKIVSFHLNLDDFEVDDQKTVINECTIYSIVEFSGPPINITQIATGKLMIRLKEFLA